MMAKLKMNDKNLEKGWQKFVQEGNRRREGSSKRGLRRRGDGGVGKKWISSIGPYR